MRQHDALIGEQMLQPDLGRVAFEGADGQFDVAPRQQRELCGRLVVVQPQRDLRVQRVKACQYRRHDGAAQQRRRAYRQVTFGQAADGLRVVDVYLEFFEQTSDARRELSATSVRSMAFVVRSNSRTPSRLSASWIVVLKFDCVCAAV